MQVSIHANFKCKLHRRFQASSWSCSIKASNTIFPLPVFETENDLIYPAKKPRVTAVLLWLLCTIHFVITNYHAQRAVRSSSSFVRSATQQDLITCKWGDRNQLTRKHHLCLLICAMRNKFPCLPIISVLNLMKSAAVLDESKNTRYYFLFWA